MPEKESGTPMATNGYQVTRFNALQHGVLSRYSVLPWEDKNEYEALLAALVAEHMPQGATEEHLVEEIAGIIWRKQRLRLAEVAAQRQGLRSALARFSRTEGAGLPYIFEINVFERVINAMEAKEQKTVKDIVETERDETKTIQILNRLRTDRNDAYEAAVAALPEEARELWETMVTPDPAIPTEGHVLFTADAIGLRQFLEDEILPWFAARRKNLASRLLAREQALGEAMNPDTLERLARYEAHLDRKLERMLAMLLKLKELRRPANAD